MSTGDRVAPVRWGFLGAGSVARRGLAPAVHSCPEAELVAVASRDVGRAEALEPRGRCYGSYAQLLADPLVEAVYISLPNDAHLPATLAALEAGKHVLTEKPLGRTAEEVRQMVDAARRTRLLLVEASWYRWHPRTRRVEALLAAGALGPLTRVDAGFTFRGVPAGDYRWDPDHGGGALYDVGCYAASALLVSTGWPVLTPQVTTAAARWAPSGVDLGVTARLQAGEVTLRLTAGIAEPARQWWTVTARRGSLALPETPFTAWNGQATSLLLVSGREVHVEDFAACDPYRLMVTEVSRAIRGQPAYLVAPERSREVAGLLDTIRGRIGGLV
ncbi:MAG: Gfo/Idh/MocA family protein [Actinomycetes bacterium]